MNNINNKTKLAMILSTDYQSWPIGGTLTYIRNIIPFFDEKYDLTIFGVSVNKNEKKNVSINNKNYNINIYANVNSPRKKIPNFLLTFLGMFKNYKKLKDFDILVFHSSLELIALKIRYGKNLPYSVFIQHSFSYLKSKKILLKYYYKILGSLSYKLSDLNLIVTDNDSFDEYIQKKGIKNNFFRIGSPIDYYEITKRNKQLSNTCIKFVYTGRLSVEKQVDKTIMAFISFTKKYNVNSTLDLIGSGPLEQSLKEYVSSKGLNSKIKFHGNKSYTEIKESLCSYDIFLMSSMGEGVSLSTLEAMAAGLPVIAYDVTGMRNLVENGVNGYLSINDNIEDFVNNMNLCISNYEILSTNALITAEKFDKKNISKEIINIIDNNYVQ